MNKTVENLTIKKRKPKRYTVQEQNAHINAWKESKLSMSKYSSQNGLPLATFYGWTKVNSSHPTGTFIPIAITEKKQAPPPPEQELAVELKNGMRILIKQLIDTRVIAKLIKEIEQCS